MASAFAAFAEGDAIDYSVRAQSQDSYDIEVTGCRYDSSIRSWVSPSLDSCWSAAWISRSPRVLTQT